MKLTHFRQGMRDGIPICLGYLAVSFSFGISAKNGGLSSWQATLMSLTNLTSAGQFAALSLIALGAPYFEMAVTQLVINLRYSLMSAAVSQKLEPNTPFFHRLIIAFGMTDEIFGVSVGVQGRLSPFYSYGLMAVAIPGWTLGTFLGVVTGSILPSRLLSALGVALYGMFLAVIIPPARGSRVLTGIILLSMGAGAAFAFLPLVRQISFGFRIIILTIFIAGAAAMLFPVKEADNER